MCSTNLLLFVHCFPMLTNCIGHLRQPVPVPCQLKYICRSEILNAVILLETVADVLSKPAAPTVARVPP